MVWVDGGVDSGAGLGGCLRQLTVVHVLQRRLIETQLRLRPDDRTLLVQTAGYLNARFVHL